MLNLQDERAQAIAHRMAPAFDVVVANPRAGVLDRQRIDDETPSALRPDPIYARVTGFGPTGPPAEQAASDIVGKPTPGCRPTTAPALAGHTDEVLREDGVVG